MTDERTFVETFPLRRRQSGKWALHRDGESHGGSPVCNAHFDVSLLAIAEYEPAANIYQSDAFVGIGIVAGFPFSGIRDSYRDSIGLAFDSHAHIPRARPRGNAVPNGVFDQGLDGKNWNRNRQGLRVNFQLAAEFRAE